MPYYVYILASKPNGTLYTGVTNNIARRIFEHKNKTHAGFTTKYNVTMLVHLEETSEINTAIAREKQIKSWSRKKKIQLIELQNPTWQDMAVTA